MRKILVICLAFTLFGCAELLQIANTVNVPVGTEITNLDIANGLREALQKGVSVQVQKLTNSQGFYNNADVKILFPAELQKVDVTLRKIGLSSLADKGIMALNAAAEDAVKTSMPIFVEAVRGIGFKEAKTILMGNADAATVYLKQNTETKLYQSFNPIVKQSFSKVGADKIWSELITKYNTIPLVTKINPDLNAYVTQKAMDGVFKMIAIEESAIRTDVNQRSSVLLKRVFALQDNQ